MKDHQLSNIGCVAHVLNFSKKPKVGDEQKHLQNRKLLLKFDFCFWFQMMPCDFFCMFSKKFQDRFSMLRIDFLSFPPFRCSAEMNGDKEMRGVKKWGTSWRCNRNEVVATHIFFMNPMGYRGKVGGGNSHIFYVHPELWGNDSHFDEHIFSNGLVQPPTRKDGRGVDLECKFHLIQVSSDQFSPGWLDYTTHVVYIGIITSRCKDPY